jgi:alkanesulfonate monooxygenase SsuD/methylene tetrahydromethanopterin reductase-like flavin-dependent oxidoreductase (luciferase family)
VARAGQGWHTFNRTPEQLAEPLATLDALLADQGRTRSEITLTVCPYFQPLDADIAGRYAEAGVDAVAALLLPFSEDDVKKALDDLQPVFDRAAAS